MTNTTTARVVLAALVSLTLLQPPAHAASKELSQLIDLLIARNAITSEEAAGLRARIAGQEAAGSKGEKKDPGVTARAPIRLSGYSQFQYRGGARDDQGKRVPDTFLFRRVRLSFTGSLTSDLDYKLQAELSGSRKVIDSVNLQTGKTTSGLVSRPLLVDMLLGYRLGVLPLGRVQAGQFKIPFSIENLISSSELETIGRSQLGELLVPGRDIGAQGRDVGLQLSAGLPGRNGKPVADFALGVYNGAGINVSDDNQAKDVALRAVAYPLAGVSVGGSAYLGRAGARRLRHNRIGGELVWRGGPWWGRAELVRGRGNGKDDERRKQGWYVLGGLNAAKNLQALLRYDALDPDLDADGDRGDIYTAGANWFLSSRSKLQVNYELRNGQRLQPHARTLLTQCQLSF